MGSEQGLPWHGKHGMNDEDVYAVLLLITHCLHFQSLLPAYSAILRDSHILLLDEISAALDSVSEAALHSALERVLKVIAPVFVLLAGLPSSSLCHHCKRIERTLSDALTHPLLFPQCPQYKPARIVRPCSLRIAGRPSKLRIALPSWAKGRWLR